MPRSDSRRKPQATPGVIGAAVAASGAAIARNPVMVGSSTAFLVTLFYVSANALWYQPFPHPGPLLQTRILVERESAPVLLPAPRPVDVTNSVPPRVTQSVAPPPLVAAPAATENVVARIQRSLSELGFYDGAVDGKTGPRTRKAITDYQKLVGVDVTGEASEELVQLLDLKVDAQETRSLPVPVPRGVVAAQPAPMPAVLRSSVEEAQIVKIQAGLKAFGNEGIEVDGVIGEQTRSAIREFQSLFGLPVTGEPDGALFSKMAEIGLTN